jgi:serine/threonine protein kinase
MLTLGGFGEVWKGIWTMLPGRYVAIKKIKLLANDMNQFRAVNQQENTKTLPSKKSKLHRGSHTRGSKSEGDGSHFEKYFNSVDDNGYNNNGDDGMDASWVDQEIMLLMRTRHRRVVLFLGAGKIKLTGEIFLVSEYMDGGDLRNVITKSKNKITGESTMKWSHRYMIAYDIAEGMEFLHSR